MQNIRDVIKKFPITARKIYEVRTDVYKVSGLRRSYCLKYYESITKLKVQNHILRSLHRKGFQKFNLLLESREKQGYVVDNIGVWQLTKWIPGSQPNFKNKSQLKAALQTLAKFHTKGVDIPFPKTTNTSYRYDTLYQQWEQRYKDLLTWQSEYQSTYLEQAAELAEESLEALQSGSALHDLIQYEYSQRAIVHGDYNYPNLVRKKDGTIYLIDFENAAHDIRIRDLAHIVQRNVQKDIDKAKWMVRTYERKRPLTKVERAVLASILAFPYQFWREINMRTYHKKEVLPIHLRKWGELYLSGAYSRQIKRMR